MFLTDQQILQAVSDALQNAGGVGTLPPFWTSLVPAEHLRAYNALNAILNARRYTAAQIAAWDDGPSNERDLSLFFLFSTPRVAGQKSPEVMKAWDVRPGLVRQALTINGVLAEPGGTAAPVQGSGGEIGVGRINSCRDDRVPGLRDGWNGCGW